ncbi:Rad52/Rad22 family DNA repair protein [Fibrobacter sp.]|uniref:Rad52/Rad22 family DNA repair protein n=1 Tax=Fibrobacter sp. TaxID=35828 RepID=UPI00388EAA39
MSEKIKKEPSEGSSKLVFRKLMPNEIECRIGQIKENGLTLLLYKDARVDMNILDETVGPLNWKREHGRDNRNCIVSIWDRDKKEWVSKEDTGTESNTEAEKGLASDSFKRACVNWGIGRELYSAPFIWVKNGDAAIAPIGGKYKCFDKFKVVKLTYKKNGDIDGLAIKNTKTNQVVFTQMPKEKEEK